MKLYALTIYYLVKYKSLSIVSNQYLFVFIAVYFYFLFQFFHSKLNIKNFIIEKH